MKAADVVPAFLTVCPTIGPAWQQYLESWAGSQNEATPTMLAGGG